MISNLKTLGIVVSILASSSLFITSCSGNKAAEQQKQAPELKVQQVGTGTIELETAFPATIKGKTDIEVRPMVSGNITAVRVDEGQTVHKGQVLFVIDQVPYKAAVDQAQAAVNVASTAVETSRISYDSNKALFDKNIISAHALQIAANQLAQAQAQLAQAQAGLVNARKNLSYTEVTAPSDGVVGSIPLREGALASPSGQALTTVSDIAQVYAYFSLNEKEVLDLTNSGATTLEAAIAAMPAVSLRLANGAMYPLPGKVATVSGVINPTTGAATVRALFDNVNRMLRSGSTATVIMPLDQPDAIIIPQKATFEVQNKRFVYVVDADNTIHSAPITVMAQQDGRNFVVTSGLEPGQTILTEGIGTVAKEGLTITPVTATAETPAETPAE